MHRVLCYKLKIHSTAILGLFYNMTLELLKILVNPKLSEETCFLCFKKDEKLTNIHSKLVIVGDYQEFTVSVFDMASYLFSLQEAILQEVCDKCLNIVISIYILLQKHHIMKHNLLKLTKQLEKAISTVNVNEEKCYLNIHDSDDEFSTNRNSSSNCEVLNKEFLKCTKCDMKFESKVQLQEHAKLVHTNTNRAIICHICGKICKTPSSLKGHMNCHKEKECPYCLKSLKTHSHYKIHVQNHVSCSKRKRNHTSYNCHNCSFVSLSKGSLEAHINKTHLGLRPHVCPVCCKGFFKNSNLTEHISIHSKVKTETCEICGDNFVSKKTLMEHLRLHENQKPYKCDICLKTFVTSGRRSDHVKRKHMEKTECCLICNKMFSLKKELNRHVKKSHWPSNVPEIVEHCVNAESLMPHTRQS